MKKLIILVIACGILSSCTYGVKGYSDIYYSAQLVIPDSLTDDAKQFSIDILDSPNYTSNNYQKRIREANYQALKMYGVPTEGLKFKECPTCPPVFIPAGKLSSSMYEVYLIKKNAVMKYVN